MPNQPGGARNKGPLGRCYYVLGLATFVAAPPRTTPLVGAVAVPSWHGLQTVTPLVQIQYKAKDSSYVQGWWVGKGRSAAVSQAGAKMAITARLLQLQLQSRPPIPVVLCRCACCSLQLC